MSTIADYSVFTKVFLASGMTDFSQLYGKIEGEAAKAFAVIPFNLDIPLTPREAMNFDRSKFGQARSMARRVSCRDANGNFIGNIVRVQPNKRDGSIRFVAKVAVPGFVSSETESNPADDPYNTFVLVRTDASTGMDLPIAVATISKGYNLHRHKVVVTNVNDPFDVNFADPLDDVENANYVSFTINNLNGYTSVDFNPDAYATYDDVANALSRGIDGLHIAFDTASGDLKLLDKDGNVLDQANLPIKTDVIIAEGEEGYKYVKTDVKQDIHAAKAWMPEGFTAWDAVPAADYEMQHAALVVGKGAQGGSGHSFVPSSNTAESYPISVVTYTIGDPQDGLYTLTRSSGTIGPETITGVSWKEGGQLPFKTIGFPVTGNKVEFLVITYDGKPYLVYESENGDCSASDLANTSDWEPSVAGTIVESGTSGGTSTGGVLGITLDRQSMYTFEEGATTPQEFKDSSGHDVTWFGTKTIPDGYTLKYGLEAFVWTVKDRKVKLDEPFFQQLNASLLALGFHEGDDIALGKNLAKLSTDLNRVDADKYIHGKDNKALREREVDAQRANAKEELVAWNAQHPGLTADREHGTIIDSSGLDVRAGHITLGCGRIGKEGEFQKVNYGIQMRERFGVGDDHNTYDSLDFTVSHHTGKVKFDESGHAAQPGGNGGLVPLTSSTLLSIEAGSYISGAPTCLILAKVSRSKGGTNPEGGSPNPPEGSPVLTPVRMTAGFSVGQNYDASNGLNLTLHDYRDNIKAVLGPEHNPNAAPSIIEVQAIYTHQDARNETVPAQQMHTYIGSWDYSQPNSEPTCSFLCNKIEEWMTAVGLADTDTAGVELYVVIRVY